MAFLISTLKLFFIVLNLLTLFSCAFYLGFGVFLAISQTSAMGFGMKELAIAALGGGAAVLLFSIIGFSAVSGRRRMFMNFFSFLLLCLSIFQLGFAIVCAIRRTKVDAYMSDAWDQLTETSKLTFEAAYSCCGFKDVSDRTACTAEKAASAQPCSVQLSGRQSTVLQWMIAGSTITGLISFINYIVSRGLSRQYRRAQIRFKQQQKQMKLKAASTEAVDSGPGTKAPEKEQVKEPVKEVIKTSPLKSNDRGLHFLADFFKPVPKPISNTDRSARSSGSNLTYEEIAAKYRPSK